MCPPFIWIWFFVQNYKHHLECIVMQFVYHFMVSVKGTWALYFTHLAHIHTYTCICIHTRNTLFNLILMIMHDAMSNILQAGSEINSNCGDHVAPSYSTKSAYKLFFRIKLQPCRQLWRSCGWRRTIVADGRPSCVWAWHWRHGNLYLQQGLFF